MARAASLPREPSRRIGQLEAPIPHRGARPCTGSDQLQLTRGPVGKQADEPSCHDDHSSTRPDGISVRNCNGGRALRRQSLPMEGARRLTPHRSQPIPKSSTTTGIRASGEALFAGPVEA